MEDFFFQMNDHTMPKTPQNTVFCDIKQFTSSEKNKDHQVKQIEDHKRLFRSHFIALFCVLN